MIPTNGPDPEDVAEGFRERAETLLQMAASARYCYEDFEVIEPKAAKKHLRPVVLEPLKAAERQARGAWRVDQGGHRRRRSSEVAASFDINLGKLGQPIRVAVTGGPVSPPIDVTVWLIGRERALAAARHGDRDDRSIEQPQAADLSNKERSVPAVLDSLGRRP